MKRQPTASLRARNLRWSLVTTTRGLLPVWVSAKAYDAAAKRLIKGARDRYGKVLLKSRSAPLRLDLTLVRQQTRRVSASSGSGCGYVVVPEVIGGIRGLAQVWVRERIYDAVASDMIRATEGKDVKRLLRQRMAPLGVDWECTGTCDGGWCKEVVIQPDELSAVYVCECSYFV